MRKFFGSVGNGFVKFTLKTPLHFIMSSRVMLISFTGRKSGKIYTIPVEYHLEERTVTFITQQNRKWWKNLQDNAGVILHIKGREVEGMVETLIFDPLQVSEHMRMMYPRLSEDRLNKLSANAIMILIGIGWSPV